MKCVFCSIVAGELPCRKIFEDDKTLAILDIAGDVDGHMLVLPKTHVESVLDCDSKTLDAVMRTVQTVSKHLSTIGYDGVNILNASGKAADQSVPHLHFHLIPRRFGDHLNTWPTLPGAITDIDELHSQLSML